MQRGTPLNKGIHEKKLEEKKKKNIWRHETTEERKKRLSV